MKKLLITLALILLPLACSAQLLGLGIQYADAKSKGNDFQFAANLSYPTWHKKNSFNTFIASGISYTGGSSPMAGLNIKPIQVTSFISESLYNNNPFTILVSGDVGYLFNLGHGKSGIVLTPGVYIDYKFVYIKSGYDFNITGNQQQFFVQAGICLSIGSFKAIKGTRIW